MMILQRAHRKHRVVRARRRIKALRDAGDQKQLDNFIAAWLGHASHADARNLASSLGLAEEGR